MIKLITTTLVCLFCAYTFSQDTLSKHEQHMINQRKKAPLVWVYSKDGSVIHGRGMGKYIYNEKGEEIKKIDRTNRDQFVFGESQADTNSLRMLNIIVNYKDDSLTFRKGGASHLKYIIISDSLLIYESTGTSTTGGLVTHPTVLLIRDLSSQPKVKREKAMYKVDADIIKTLLVKHYNDCQGVQDVINKYEGNRRKQFNWTKVLIELQKLCPEMSYDRERILNALMKED